MKLKKYLYETGLNVDKIAAAARKAHDSTVKQGKIKFDGNTYDIYFDSKESDYIFSLKNEEIIRFNTRKITDAKKWFIEYMNN